MIVPIAINLHSLLGILLSSPFILGYMPRQGYDPPAPPPPDRRSPEEKEFDRMIKALETEIDKLTRLKDAHLQQKECERELKTAVGNVEAVKTKLESTKKTIEELLRSKPSENPR